MYPHPWQRWAWASIPAISLTAFTFVPFIIAWRRGVVGWRTLAIYTILSGLTIAGAATELDIRQWGTFWREVIRYTGWAYLIAGVVHLALLDWPSRGRHETAKG
ncbi:hypothetical protein [Streptomyces antibioticus]|uniref:Uncharacterized protein n=2 Tax=Streptomyces antibioticus TaxID=1890 RepID=A0AAE6YF05_STRAT|nr:hypothetical protein [Streptomyces antibioticus]OOQ47302.1 hypothetical protein AFM16_31675 [Streptomyces antibioticus]QIT47624.1 hypothetical protein HCX60_32230 [Streptomyces antibioticus]